MSAKDAAADRPSDAPAARVVEFWSEVIEPNGAEVAVILGHARTMFRIVDDAAQADGESAVKARTKYFEDIYGMLRHARKLSPSNLDVLSLLGRAADELGKSREAIEALEMHVTVGGPERANAEAIGRLGALHLRQGNRDTAIRWLELAQGPLRAENVHALLTLANALAARGDVTHAADLLRSSLPPQALGYFTAETSLVMFTLAVIYDRDEQRAAAFEILDRLKLTLQAAFASQMQNVLTPVRWSPPEDQYYYQGLLYEVLDQFAEARASFALYAAAGDTPFRARALEHVRALDARRRLPRPAPKVGSPMSSPPGVINVGGGGSHP